MPANQQREPRRSASAALEMPLLTLILLAAIGLRVAGLGQRGLWLDEFWAAELSTGRGSAHLELPANQLLADPPNLTSLSGAAPWYRVWSTMEATHPPLYFLALRLWREYVGDDDVMMRALSVVASLAAIVLLYLAVRVVQPMGVALWSAMLMAAAPAQIRLAQEARGYALLTALGCGALLCLALLKARGAHWTRALSLALVSCAMMLTHYFAAGAVLALGALALLWLEGAARRQALVALVSSVLVFVVAWGPSMWSHRQLFAVDDPATVFLRDDRPDRALQAVVNLLAAPAATLDPQLPRAASASAGAMLLLSGALLLIRRRRDDLLPWYTWLAGVLVVLAALDLFRSTTHLAHVRYIILAAPGVYALLAVMPRSGAAAWRHLLPALALLAAVIGLPRYYAQWRADARIIANDVRRYVPPGEPIIFAAPPEKRWQAGAMYLQVSHYAQPLQWPVVVLHEPADEALLSQLRPFGRAWAIDGWDPAPLTRLLPGFDQEAQITYGGLGRLVRVMPQSPAP